MSDHKLVIVSDQFLILLLPSVPKDGVEQMRHRLREQFEDAGIDILILGGMNLEVLDMRAMPPEVKGQAKAVVDWLDQQ